VRLCSGELAPLTCGLEVLVVRVRREALSLTVGVQLVLGTAERVEISLSTRIRNDARLVSVGAEELPDTCCPGASSEVTQNNRK